MKKILLITLVIPLFLFTCTKPDMPVPPPIDKIFNATETSITNGQSIHFDLPSAGVYTLTLIDKQSGNVISRERFNGKSGENVKKIYTKSLQSKYLYLLLEDVTKKEIGKTTIIIN